MEKKVYKLPKKYYQISKHLSYLLRHNSDTLIMDDYGYLDVEEILQYLNINIFELEDVVKTSDKQRFSFNEDKTLIKANQGHTLDIIHDFEKIQPPSILYHGAPESKLKIILEEGLKKMNRHHVHLSKDIVTAEKVGARRGKFHVLEINAIDMYVDGYKFYISKNGVWLTNHVPVKYIRF